MSGVHAKSNGRNDEKHGVVLASELWHNNQHESADLWFRSIRFSYGVLQAKELVKVKKESIESRSKKEVDKSLNEMSLQELNQISLKIANDYLKNYPNTWKEEIGKDTGLKKVKKQIKLVKNGRKN